MTAEEVVRLLGLGPHPEGGFFCETFRDPGEPVGRGASTAIYYLLRDGEVSAWHRVRDAAEVWHHYAGAPTWRPGSGPRRWCRPASGRPPGPWAAGPW